MLADFKSKIDALQNFNIELEMANIINLNSDYILDLLRTQLASGRDRNNEDITIFGSPFYAARTVQNKKKHGVGLGEETRWITNYMSGRFYNELRVTSDGTDMEFSSDVEYFENIIARSGTKILSLDRANLKLFTNDVLMPALKQRFEMKFNGL